MIFRNESEFREQEKELREKDLGIQDSIIKFSIFLQENERKKKRADEKINNEKRVCTISITSHHFIPIVD